MFVEIRNGIGRDVAGVNLKKTIFITENRRWFHGGHRGCLRHGTSLYSPQCHLPGMFIAIINGIGRDVAGVNLK
jgi:hypothetical protein